MGSCGECMGSLGLLVLLGLSEMKGQLKLMDHRFWFGKSLPGTNAGLESGEGEATGKSPSAKDMWTGSV
jgi:hypothetical protein